MCLAIPAQLKTILSERGIVTKDGVELEVDLTFLPNAQIGDYLVIHAGIALSIMESTDALETLRMLSLEGDNDE